MTWTSTDNEKVMAQGWEISLNEGSNKNEIVRHYFYKEDSKFDSDEQAFQYVKKMAIEGGSELHYRALQHIGYFERFEYSMGESMSHLEAPPIGLRPKSIWMKIRLKEIKEAAKRYEEAGKEIPSEWLEEAGELALKLEDWDV